MAIKERVCKNCGFLTTEDKCEKCGSNNFIEKYKGKIAIFDAKRSELANKLGIETNGRFALKYN